MKKSQLYSSTAGVMWVLKYNTLETNIFPNPSISSTDKNTRVDNAIKPLPPPPPIFTSILEKGENSFSQRKQAASQIDLCSNKRRFTWNFINYTTATIVTSTLRKKGTAHTAKTLPQDMFYPANPVWTEIHANPWLHSGIAWGNIN